MSDRNMPDIPERYQALIHPYTFHLLDGIRDVLGNAREHEIDTTTPTEPDDLIEIAENVEAPLPNEHLSFNPVISFELPLQRFEALAPRAEAAGMTVTDFIQKEVISVYLDLQKKISSVSEKSSGNKAKGSKKSNLIPPKSELRRLETVQFEDDLEYVRKNCPARPGHGGWRLSLYPEHFVKEMAQRAKRRIQSTENFIQSLGGVDHLAFMATNNDFDWFERYEDFPVAQRVIEDYLNQLQDRFLPKR